MVLSLLNLIFPGAALYWRKQYIQGTLYLLSFGLLNVFRRDIGLIWAIYVLIMAQVHFHKIRKLERASALKPPAKIAVWFISIVLIFLYILLYGPTWTNNSAIKHPVLLFSLVTLSLLLPALLLSYCLLRENQLTGFFKKRISPGGIAAYLPKLANQMGVERILSAIAEQVGVTESEIPKKATESVWAFQIFMVTQAVKRSFYSPEAQYIILGTFKEACADLAKQFGYNYKIVSSMINEFSSKLKDGRSEEDFHNLAATILRRTVGNTAANSEKFVKIIDRWIFRMNGTLDKELARYKLTW